MISSYDCPATVPQIRNLLDPIAPTERYPLFRLILEQLEQAGELSQFRDFNQTLLVPLDGTWCFSSQKLDWPQAVSARWSTAKHCTATVLSRRWVKPGQPYILPLEPEFIVPQDDTTKTAVNAGLVAVVQSMPLID